MSGEDDEFVLDESEQTMRPKDDAIHQQRIHAWHPVLDPVWVIVALLYLGVIMVPVGFKIESLQDDVVEMKITYDGVEGAPCSIGTNYSAGRTCILNFTAPKYMAPPILIHYELTDFHQNHRDYYRSRDDYQLRGKPGPSAELERDRCKPLYKLGDLRLNPCGLIANTFFNDIITLVSGRGLSATPLVMREDGIAWQSDIDFQFAQPEGFAFEECPDACDESCCTGEWECGSEGLPYVRSDGTCFRFVYPFDDEVQYLYETYPDIINPLEGVTNEHFIVWMRVATQPTFRKLYGWIDEPIDEGTTLQFQVNANFPVESFGGTKSLLVGTNMVFGGRNPYLGRVFYGVGFFCIIAGIFFALKHIFRPRKLADSSYLHFKTE